VQFGETDLLQKEVMAIKNLCEPGAHVNIVQVLAHGQLPNAPYYFIDMELCDWNLHNYSHNQNYWRFTDFFTKSSNRPKHASNLTVWSISLQLGHFLSF